MPSEGAIRAELGPWLDQHWSLDQSLLAWRELLVDSGWAAVSWPEHCFGRGWSQAEAAVVSRVFAERGVLPAAQTGPRRLAAETLLAHGDSSQQQQHLRGILTGAVAWTQLFSEPGSGSDLAGLSTRAERQNGHWCMNGQKVWNTSAHHADWGFMLARSNWDLPKHQGLSFFLINMRQPGVEVRPLRQMNGHASFNEVFLTNAMVAAEDLVGQEGEGWRIAATTLSVERQGFASDRNVAAMADQQGQIFDDYRAEQAIAQEPYTWYPQRAGRVDLVLPRARANGAIHDPGTRQALAKLLCLKRAADLAAKAAAAQRKVGSNAVLPAASIAKLAASEIARQASHVHTLISGADAMRAGADSELGGLVAEILLSVPAISIAGGTDEIQKNIISERVLGMPKEHRVDTGPFRDIPRNTGAKDR